MATDETFRANVKAMLLDPGQRDEVRRMLNLGGDHRVNSQSKVESKSFKRLDKFLGVMGSWREWSFNFLTTMEGLNGPVAKTLTEVGKQSAGPLTKDALTLIVPTELKEKHGGELFLVLCELTGGEANSAVRSVAGRPEFGRFGIAAYYALSYRFNPRTPSRALQFLSL